MECSSNEIPHSLGREQTATQNDKDKKTNVRWKKHACCIIPIIQSQKRDAYFGGKSKELKVTLTVLKQQCQTLASGQAGDTLLLDVGTVR